MSEQRIWLYWPTIYKGIVTQPFGNNPQYYSQFGLPGHEGLDMRTYHGTEISACWPGTVVRNDFHNAYGNHIRIRADIESETYEFVYAHFSEPTQGKLA